ncbi:metallophosphoesterase [Kocuria rosea]|uniref:metallophosphoesterase n=1 Tax=Kocuria rosea TaxID=1275 RepID=UPI0035B27822
MSPRHAPGGAGLLRAAAATAGAGAAAAAGLGAWGVLVERRRFQLRTERLRLLPEGSAPLRILHLSDLHVWPGQRSVREFVHSLAGLQPDLVVDTGDNLSHLDALPWLLEILEPLLRFPGAYVPGSNCYFAPRLKNPVRYLWRDTSGESRDEAPRLPTQAMHDAFDAAGWTPLINRAARLEVAGRVLDLSGVDDPHLGYDEHPGFVDPATADLRIGVAHAPYLRTLDRFAEDGAQLVLAGHTHGGQVCLPGGRALVSNCDLEPARCKGLITQRGVPVNVSAGLGTSRFAPIRLFCPPEAVLLTLTD